MKTVSEGIFELLMFSVSALLLVLMLFGCIELSRAEHEASRLNAEIAGQRFDNRALSSECDNIMSLAQLEQYAREELGMKQPAPWQLVYCDLPG